MMSRKALLPGCAWPSYNPKSVGSTLEYLLKKFPDLSVVQKCCGKPTQALGQEDMFEERFATLVKDIKLVEADEVIVACQSCMKVLKKCDDYKVTSLWELFPKIGLPPELVGKAKNSDVVFSIHDACSVREYSDLHDGIRWILDELGYKHVDPPRSRDKARCCGFGGMITSANRPLSLRVMKRIVDDCPTSKIVVYCAACRQSMLRAGGQAWHIMDLIWGDVVMNNSSYPVDVLAIGDMPWVNRAESKQLIEAAYK